MRSLQICVSLIFFYHCISIEGNVFHNGSDFLALSKTNAFVDKTMLIKQIFEAGKRFLITAPSQFGKSTNLNMLKTFLSVNSFTNKMIKDTFKTLHISENNISFFSEHFGKYPVVYVNFKADTINSYQQALNAYRQAIHNAYLEHKYLQISRKLSEDKKTLCTDWCGENRFKTMKEEDIQTGLISLVQMVQEDNSNMKIVVLIDEYDSAINSAVLHVRDDFELDNIDCLISDILSAIIQVTYDYVQLVVITGISYISSMGLSEINCLRQYYFLDDHPLVKFYGFTENEVVSLYAKDDFNRHSSKREIAKEFYNGYTSKRGSHIYNTYSFLKFLETGETIVHWDRSGYIANVIVWIKYKEMAEIFDSLLNNESVNLTVQSTICLIDVMYLRKVYSEGNTQKYLDTDLLLSHLLEIGLLTYDTISNDTGLDDGQFKVKFPNLEVHGTIFNDLKKYFTEKCNLPKFLSASYPAFKQDLYQLYNSTNDHCKPIAESFIKGRLERRYVG